MHILYLSANPEWTEDLKLERELRAVSDRIFWAVTNGTVQLEFIAEARRVDLQRYVTSRKPQILHFSGHGENNQLQLSSQHYEVEVADKDWLKKSLANKGIKIALLNCCWSASLAEALSESVDVVIGCTVAIKNEIASAFSPAFYEWLLLGATIQEAYDRAVEEAGEGYQITGNEAVLQEALIDPRAQPVASGQRSHHTESERSGPPTVDAEALPKTPAQTMGLYFQQFLSMKEGWREDWRWNWAKVGISLLIAFAVWAAYTLLASWLDAESIWALWPLGLLAEAGEGLFTDVRIEIAAIFTFLSAGTGAKLLSLFWMRRGVTKAEKALAFASVLPEEEQRTEIELGRIERSLKRLEETAV